MTTYNRVEEYQPGADPPILLRVHYVEDPGGQYVDDGNGGFKLDETLNPDYNKPWWKVLTGG